jgi:transposase
MELFFGAACPTHGTAAGLVLPYVSAEAMGLHLDEIEKADAPGSHALLIVDGAGWHGAKCFQVPDKITLIKLPPHSPELNTMENVWAYLRANKLTITTYDTYDEILDKCAQIWDFFANDQERVTSITDREWARVN